MFCYTYFKIIFRCNLRGCNSSHSSSASSFHVSLSTRTFIIVLIVGDSISALPNPRYNDRLLTTSGNWFPAIHYMVICYATRWLERATNNAKASYNAREKSLWNNNNENDPSHNRSCIMENVKYSLSIFTWNINKLRHSVPPAQAIRKRVMHVSVNASCIINDLERTRELHRFAFRLCGLKAVLWYIESKSIMLAARFCVEMRTYTLQL